MVIVLWASSNNLVNRWTSAAVDMEVALLLAGSSHASVCTLVDFTSGFGATLPPLISLSWVRKAFLSWRTWLHFCFQFEVQSDHHLIVFSIWVTRALNCSNSDFCNHMHNLSISHDACQIEKVITESLLHRILMFYIYLSLTLYRVMRLRVSN